MPDIAEDRDPALVDGIAARDEAAFTVFYRRYLPVVLRWCLRETGNREIAARNKLLESRRRKRVEDSARRRLRLEPVSLSDADLERVEELASLDEEILSLVEGLPGGG
jgi:hypothetical protein